MTHIPADTGIPVARDWRIRLATQADIVELSATARRIFHDTFAAFNTPEDMAAYNATAFTPEAFARAIQDHTHNVLIAVPKDLAGADATAPASVLGFAQLRHGPPHASVGSQHAVEIQRFYVDRPYHGSGLAQALMATVAEHVTQSGGSTIWLGVWEHNTRAIAFYQKIGFSEVGETTFILGTDVQRDLVMAAAIDRLRLHAPA